MPPLPPGKSVEDVLTDFLRYLLQCAYTYIKEIHTGFNLNSPSIENSIEFVLTHPNGWEGEQQQSYRRAVERAGFVPTTRAGRSRIHLIPEGEASLRCCISSLREPSDNTEPQGVVIIDAGGGIINLSMYSMTFDPLFCEEMAPPECMWVLLAAEFLLIPLLFRSPTGFSHRDVPRCRLVARLVFFHSFHP